MTHTHLTSPNSSQRQAACAAVEPLLTEPDGTTPGTLLRAARDAAGLSQQDVAAMLRITSNVVDDMENDNYAWLKAPIFIRGHLRAYAKLFDLPTENILAFCRVPQTNLSPQAAKHVQAEITTKHHSIRWTTYGISAALLLSFTSWWYNQRQHNDPLQHLQSDNSPALTLAKDEEKPKAIAKKINEAEMGFQNVER